MVTQAAVSNVLPPVDSYLKLFSFIEDSFLTLH